MSAGPPSFTTKEKSPRWQGDRFRGASDICRRREKRLWGRQRSPRGAIPVLGSVFLEAKDGLNWQEPSTSRRKGKHSSGEAAHLRKGQAVGGRNEIGVFLGREARTCRGVSCRSNESKYREQRNGLLLEAMHARVTRSNTWVFLPHRCIEGTRDTRLRARSPFLLEAHRCTENLRFRYTRLRAPHSRAGSLKDPAQPCGRETASVLREMRRSVHSSTLGGKAHGQPIGAIGNTTLGHRRAS